MNRKFLVAVATLLALGATPSLAEGISTTGLDERECAAGKSAFLVTVRGFASDIGAVRVQLYRTDNGSFLGKGAWLVRAERKRDGKERMRFCVPVPGPGRYGIAVRHDSNGNGKSDWSDGGGFSRNPALSVFKLKPDADKVEVRVEHQPVSVDVVLQYRSGLSIRPNE
jgi:uncharacterized protein (DUF2141 family)